jgi:hypothetical protein
VNWQFKKFEQDYYCEKTLIVQLLCQLSFAAVLGVSISTAGTCVVGLFAGTGTWCALPLYWIFGFPPAIAVSIIFGFPTLLAFRRFQLKKWWHFVAGGALFSSPIWWALAQPFDSPRWLENGLFDSLNFIGSGALGGFAFWGLAIRRTPVST